VAADPGFDRFRFLEMAKSRFGAVKAALAAWQPQPCRTFMTPALYQSWSAQVLDQAAHRIRNVFDDLQVGEPQLVWVQPGPSFQHVAVQLNATSLHYAFNEATRQLLFGDDDTMRAFTEYWTFSRPAGARTAAPAQAARCLLCGAPLLPGAQFCAYCKNAVTPPGGGWLVSRMDEELIWQDD
jgi:predicted lipid-binding transport protein (Tim44 family)